MHLTNNSYSLFTRFIASVLIFSLLSLYFNVAYSQTDLGAAGRQGQELTNQITNSFNMPSKNGNNIDLGSGENLNLNEMFPGTSSTGNKPSSYFFPDGYNASPSSYEDYYDSASSLDTKGSNAQAALYADAVKDDPNTVQGAAYKIIMDTANRSRPDMSQDPMFNQSRDVADNINDWKQNFGDCTTETEIKEVEKTVHVPEYETCERVADYSQSCTIHHEYDAGVVKHSAGPLNLASCGEGCMHIWIGRVGDNYWSGRCSIFEESTAVELLNPEAITSAVLDYVKFDDYMQVWVGDVGSETKVYNGPNGNFPPETGGACELETSWERSPGVDVTSYFKQQKGSIVNFKIRVSVSGEGEGYGSIRVYYDPSKVLLKDEWIASPGCLEAGVAVEDAFASGDITCVNDPTIPGTDCTEVNGVLICEDVLEENKPLNSINSLCKEVAVDSDYDFYKGSMGCWNDPDGNSVCPENTGGHLNTCKAYDENPSCGFIKSECIKGAEGSSGACYVFEDTYDCGYDVQVPNWIKEQNIQCEGPIKCMGTECLDISYTQNGDFGKAAALLNAAQFMGQDMACTGIGDDGELTEVDNVVCSIFPGEAGECKKAVGGVVNCCEKPSGLSFADYITLLMTGAKLDSAIMALGPNSSLSSIKSAYEILRNPITEGFQEVIKPFTNAVDSIGGIFEPISNAYDQVVGSLRDAVTDLFSQAFGQQVAGSSIGSGLGMEIAKEGWEQAAAAAGQDLMQDVSTQLLMENALNIISTINTLYTIYSVAIIVIKMIYECTEDELNLNVQRELKNCHKVGSYCKSEVLGICIEKRTSYCCFSSPLSRIIQEQARPQLGRDWGDAEDPSCGALSTEDLARLDWDKINLDEWLGILQSTGNWMATPDMNISNLTGAGSDLDLGGRIDAEERALKRLEGTNIDNTRIELEQSYKPSPTGS